MGRQFRISLTWREGRTERLWLSMLVDAMEQVAQAPRPSEPCDARTLAALRAQLALPAQVRFTSPFSLRN